MPYRPRSPLTVSPIDSAVTASLGKSTPFATILRSRKRAIHTAAGYAVERLEKRRLLSTVLTGGGEVNGVPQEELDPTAGYEFLDGKQQDERIAMFGDITATFTFVHVATTGAMSFTDLVAPSQDNITAGAGSFLFNIDVTSAAPNASISIAQVALPNTNGTPRPMLPFGGPEFPFTVTDPVTGELVNVSMDPNTGGAFLGAVGYTVPPGGGTPTQTLPVAEFQGVTAGFVTAPGVNMNRFLFGGTILGRVDIGGSIGTFYGGEILTGAPDGTDGGVPSFPDGSTDTTLLHNFNVAGDIGNLISKGTLGSVLGADSTLGKPTYVTAFRLSVTGHVGEVETLGNDFGSATIADSANFKGQGTPQTEEEGDLAPAVLGASAFEASDNINQADAGVPTLADDTPDFNNNTFDHAQLLGTLFSSNLGHGAIEITGALDGFPSASDLVDIYGVALDGGQTIHVTLTEPNAQLGAEQVGIFSPEALSTGTGLLASSIDSRNADRLAGSAVTLTTTEPGIYYIAIAFAGDGAFNGHPAVVPLYENDYTLSVTGVDELAIGGIRAGVGAASATGAFIEFPGSDEPLTGILAPSVTAERGDIGAILSTGLILSGDFFGGEPDAINAAAGNIRVIQAGSDIGAETGIIGLHYSPSLAAQKNVGLVQTGGIMLVNVDSTQAIGGSYQLLDAGTVMGSDLYADKAIGTIRAQTVDGSDYPIVWSVNADDKGSDGVIDLIDVTGDGSGSAVSGSFGDGLYGGPEITTGPDGNVRYMEIAPTVEVFNDNFFGGNDDQVIHYAAGAAVTLTDDSGTPVTFFPSKARNNVAGDVTATATSTGTSTSSGTGATATSDIGAGSLSALTYGIRDKGGVVIIDMTDTAGDVTVTTATGSTTGTTTTVGSTSVVHSEDAPVSLAISTSARGTNGSADIGTLNIVGPGENSTFDPFTQRFTQTPGGFAIPEDMSVSMTGKSPINVFSLVGSQQQMLLNTSEAGGQTFANSNFPTLAGMGTVSNATSGELVNFDAEDVISLSAQTLGIARSDTAATPQGAVLYDTFPFVRARTLVAVGGNFESIAGGGGGNAQSITARGALANIVVDGNIGTVAANTGGAATVGQFNGIDGPVVALNGAAASAVITTTTTNGVTTTTTALSPISGNILNVNIGQGIPFGGTGDSAPGIFAVNTIENITNQGAGSDIRGDIVASDLHGGLPAPIVISPITGLPEPTNTKVTRGAAINSINLTGGGSLIGARIFVTSTFDQVEQTNSGLVFEDPNVGNQEGATLFAIGTINLSGNGGIIGTTIAAAGIGTINNPDGFGMVNSILEATNSDEIGTITLGGYGMRSDIITGQNSVGTIDLTGNGKEIPVTSFTKSVRQSEGGATIDTFSQQPLDPSNDLDEFLGVSFAKPKRKGATEAGVIADTSITGTDRLTSLTAYRMISNTSTPVTEKQIVASEIAATPTMTLSFAQGIGKIKIKQNVTRAHITAGGIKAFDTGGTVSQTAVNSSGDIADMTAGAMSGSTHINTTGPDGTIDYLKTTLSMGAQVAAAVSIGTLSVGTNLTSTSIDSSGTLGELQVKGSIASGANVRVARTLGTLNVTHNILSGASVSAKSINKQVIGGQVFGNIVITG